MIELMFLLYLIEVLSTIDSVVYWLIFVLIAFGVGGILAPVMFYDVQGFEMQNTFNKFIKPYIKRYILALCILLSAVILIPSERTMYIMAGLYTGDKMLDTVSQSETFQKAEQLLNQKLDALLGDEK